MKDGIHLAKDETERYTVTGYGRFGTLYLLKLEDLERLRNDLKVKINEINAQLTDEQLEKLVASANAGTMRTVEREDENE